jgi:hypothetical protein
MVLSLNSTLRINGFKFEFNPKNATLLNLLRKNCHPLNYILFKELVSTILQDI